MRSDLMQSDLVWCYGDLECWLPFFLNPMVIYAEKVVSDYHLILEAASFDSNKQRASGSAHPLLWPPPYFPP